MNFLFLFFSLQGVGQMKKKMIGFGQIFGLLKDRKGWSQNQRSKALLTNFLQWLILILLSSKY